MSLRTALESDVLPGGRAGSICKRVARSRLTVVGFLLYLFAVGAQQPLVRLRVVSSRLRAQIRAVTEVLANETCALPAFNRDEFTLRSANITEGDSIVLYDHTLGREAVLCFRNRTQAYAVGFLRAASKTWIALPVNLLTSESDQSVGCSHSNWTVGEVLGGAPYVWLRCLGCGSQLIMEPIHSTRIKTFVDSTTPREPFTTQFVSILLDACSREKFPYLFPELNGFLSSIGKDKASTHVAIPLLRHNVVGYNSPPNKLAVYAGVESGNFPNGTAWLTDVATDAGFETMFFDCGVNGASSLRSGSFRTQAASESYVGEMSHWYAKEKGGAKIGDWNWATGALLDTVQGKQGRGVTSTCRYEGHSDFSHMSGQFSYPMCAGNSPIYSHKLEYLADFLNISNATRKAAFLCFDEPHHPGWLYHGLDEALTTFLRERILMSGTANSFRVPQERRTTDLSNAVYIIWSDHGLHFGPEAETAGGSAAHKQPVVWIMLPKYRTGTIETLTKNSRSLTSHYDLHETIRHFLTGDKPMASYSPHEAQSLIEPLKNPHRKCTNIGIPPVYCPCIEKETCADIGFGTSSLRIHALTKHISTLLANNSVLCHTCSDKLWREVSSSARPPRNVASLNEPAMCLSTLACDTLNVSLSVGFQMDADGALRITESSAIHSWQYSWEKCKQLGMEEKSRDVKEVCVCES